MRARAWTRSCRSARRTGRASYPRPENSPQPVGRSNALSKTSSLRSLDSGEDQITRQQRGNGRDGPDRHDGRPVQRKAFVGEVRKTCRSGTGLAQSGQAGLTMTGQRSRSSSISISDRGTHTGRSCSARERVFSVTTSPVCLADWRSMSMSKHSSSASWTWALFLKSDDRLHRWAVMRPSIRATPQPRHRLAFMVEAADHSPSPAKRQALYPRGRRIERIETAISRFAFDCREAACGRRHARGIRVSRKDP
jgi:hypothetical protein